jgi:hypothetical protein
MFMNSEGRIGMLRNQLKEAIRRKRQVLLFLACVFIMTTIDSYSRSYLERDARFILTFETLHRPPYPPDMAPKDFHLFLSLEDALCGRGRHFRFNEEVKEAVHAWLVRQTKTSYPKKFLP